MKNDMIPKVKKRLERANRDIAFMRLNDELCVAVDFDNRDIFTLTGVSEYEFLMRCSNHFNTKMIDYDD